MPDMRDDTVDEVIEPDLPIIDPHHHLWVNHHGRYLLDDFVEDLASGHKVLATIYVECGAMYRKTGPVALRSVGEAEFVGGMAAMSESGLFGPTHICAGFVGGADFRLGAALDEVLDALTVASGGRLRGMRGMAAWDAEPSVNTGVRPFAPKGLLLDAGFRAGFARLTERKLVYDAWQYHPQLLEFCSLADAFPDTPMVVNHCGGLLGIGPYATADNFARWKALVTEVSRRPNTLMKLAGLSAKRCGFGYADRPTRPTAQEIAKEWQPYIDTCLDLFGPSRCMFESNFPPDNVAGSYRTIWNALKLTASGCSAAEKSELFSGTARRIYGIE